MVGKDYVKSQVIIMAHIAGIQKNSRRISRRAESVSGLVSCRLFRSDRIPTPKCLLGVLKSFEIVIFRGINTLGRKVRENLAEIVCIGWCQEEMISIFLKMCTHVQKI